MLPTLQEAIQAIKAGDRETGRQMLADILQADLENELAWLWLSGVVDTDEEKRKYLNRVLEINPDNKAAKRGLALLDKHAVEQREPDVPQQIESAPKPVSPLLSRITTQPANQPEFDAMPAAEPALATESPEVSLSTAAPSLMSRPEPVIPPPIELEEEPEPGEAVRPEVEPAQAEPEIMPEEQADRAEPVAMLPEHKEEPDFESPPELHELDEMPVAPSQAPEGYNKTLMLVGGLAAVLLICAACVVAGLVFQPALEELSPTLIAAVGTDTPTPTVTPTPSDTPSPTSSPTITPSPTPPPTLTATPTGTRVVADTPTVTPFPTKTATPDPSRQNGQVVGVVSSIIIDVMIDGTEYRVKYLLIDTPAVNDPDRGTEPFGPEALEINRSLVEGQTVSLEKDATDTDEFGRLLRYVYVGDLLVNEALIRQGLAWVAPVPPDLKYQARFQEAQVAAQIDGVGVWSLVSSAEPTPPPPPQVVIVAVNRVEEHVDIQNAGNSPQDMTGWKLLSERDEQECTLEGVVIQPGETLRIWALLADSGRGGYNCGFTQNIWSNTEPDPAVLYAPDGREVSRLD